ncbi:hypothetical protein [Ekhidna sp.]
MKTITKILGAAFFLSLALGVNAQNGWNWGEQVDIAKEKNVLYTDALKAKNYEAAVKPLTWLLTNTPDLNPSIYIQGIKVYDGLAKKATDPSKKDEYIQKALDLHDKRIQYFGKEGDISVRKAYFAYSYYNKTKEKYPLLFELFSKAFELEGKEMDHRYLVAYMNSAYKYRFAGGELSDTQVIDIYFDISDAIEIQKQGASEGNRKKMDKSLDTIDRLLLATKVDINCDFVEENFGSKLDQGNDVKIAKKVFKLMIDGECIDRPLALKAAEIIQKDEPTYGVAKFLGAKYAKEENHAEALKYYNEAVSLTDDNSQKAEMFVNSARIYVKQGQKSTARNSARRALSFDPAFKDAFELIGDLYFSSFGSGPCYQEKSQIADRAVFIAAYDQYRRAGASAKMNAAKAQFPSIEDIFNENKEEGQSITVGCWINTTVTLERRPAN